MEKCCGEVLWGSRAGEECWREVLDNIVVEKYWRRVLERSAVKKCCGEVLYIEKCCGEVCCREVL